MKVRSVRKKVLKQRKKLFQHINKIRLHARPAAPFVRNERGFYFFEGVKVRRIFFK